MKNYLPELGQMMYGQPSQELECPEWLEAYLWHIEREWQRVSWNINQKELDNPWWNTGAEYHNPTFDVVAYSWNDEEPQEYNFRWKDVKISWYKHCGRGMSINRKVSHREAEQMLNECLKSLRAEQKQKCPDIYE